MSEQELSERAKRLLEPPNRLVFEEPASQQAFPQLDPLTFILLLPVLPFYLLLTFFSQGQPRRRLAITEIERTATGYRILEYER